MESSETPVWSEKLIAALCITSRIEFMTANLPQFPLPRVFELRKFLDWVAEQAKMRNNADASYSLNACKLFDILTEVSHGKTVGTDAAAVAQLQELSFEDRAVLLKGRQLGQKVTEIYKWAKFLVLFNGERKQVDTRPAQMVQLLGRLNGSEIELVLNNSFHVPSPKLKRLLQHELLSDIESRKQPESFSIIFVLYLFALCRQHVAGFKGKFAVTLSIVHRIFKAWQRFSESIGFRSLSEMVSPHVCFSETDAEMFIVPDHDFILPSSSETSLLITSRPGRGAPQAGQTPFGVGFSSSEAPCAFRNMPSAICAHVREFTTDLFNDIEVCVTEKDNFKTRGHPQGLSIFSEEGPFLAPRFTYSARLTGTVRDAVAHARSQSASEELRVSKTAVLVDPETPLEEPAQIPEEIAAEPCPDGCTCCKTHRRVLMTLMVNKFCAIVHSDFSNLLHAFQEAEIQLTKGTVQLVLTEPPYGMRKANEPRSLSFDSLAFSEYQNFAMLVFTLLRPGGHMVLFCDFLQLKVWYDVFSQFKNPCGHGEVVFKVDDCPLLCLPQLRGDNLKRSQRPPSHENVVFYALHLVRVSDGACHPSDMVSWRPHGHIPITYPLHTNVIDNVPMLSPFEVLPADDSRTPAVDGAPLRRDQKSTALLRELICRYSLPGDSVVDPFGGTFATAAACLTLESPRTFYGADIDIICVKRGVKRCLEELVRRILKSPQSLQADFSVDDDTRSSAQEYYERKMSSLDKAPLHSRLSSNSVPLPHSDMPYMQILPLSMRAHISSLLEDKKFLTETVFAQRGPDRWPSSAYCDIAVATSRALQVADAAMYSITCSRNGILTPAVTKDTGESLGNYYGFLVFANLAQLHGESITYGGGAYQISRDDFISQGVSLYEGSAAPPDRQLKFQGVSLRTIYVVPTPYCPFYGIRRGADSSNTNATLYVRSPKSFESILRPTHVTVRATSPIHRGEPIILSSTPEYETKAT